MQITYQQAIIIQSALDEMLHNMENDTGLSFATPEDAVQAIANVKQLHDDVVRFIFES